VKKLNGATPALKTNLQSLLWVRPVSIGPGASATAHIFTTYWQIPKGKTPQDYLQKFTIPGVQNAPHPAVVR